jgi:hypothetical protein
MLHWLKTWLEFNEAVKSLLDRVSDEKLSAPER